jgi:hypothetical protein
MSIFRRQDSNGQRWASIRTDGQRTFTVRFALRFAPLMIAFMLAWLVLGEPLLFGSPPPSAGEIARYALLSLAVWPLVGWLAATWIWRSNERRYAPPQAGESGG